MSNQEECVSKTEFVPPLEPARYAFFFDVDGTLAAIKSRPEEVSIPPAVRDNLARLAAYSDGALALVSGRPMRELDELVEPLSLALAGVHGAERRDGQGNIDRIALSPETVRTLTAELEPAIAALPGTQLESKGMAFALHYRRAPEHQQAIQQLADELVARFPELVQQPGKCVIELKPDGVSKGAAIKYFMKQPPFLGRIPVFVGDDLTDEAGFKVVNAMEGVSVKVGAGTSEARGYLPDVSAVWHWLELTRLKLDQGAQASVRSETL
ncbi:trehalose-phosphatase [Pantoea coffeiphila]|uniref:trehalose-phosphatase n=1 Tax=Pantoea coffeiphila TaxID=1465635 RepID=UPI0019602CF8|nr:trehalose-phosphatase [Pantoea coffeiphila]